MSVTIVLATRGRPGLLVETLNRTLPNIIRPDTKLVICADDDDPETVDAVNAADLNLHPNVRVSSLPREDSVGEKWNRGYRYYPADVYMILADYTAMVTPGFDQKVLDANVFPDGIGVVFGRMANASFASTYGVTHKLCDMLGWMFPPYFPFWFVDHWIDDLARLIDRVSFADVETVWPERKNPTHNYREVGFWATFYDAMKLMRRRQARAIIDSGAFSEPEWRKEVLRQHHPLIEFRSQAVNDLVRSWPPADLSPATPAYDRLKAQAIRMMQEEWKMLEGEMAA